LDFEYYSKIPRYKQKFLRSKINGLYTSLERALASENVHACPNAIAIFRSKSSGPKTTIGDIFGLEIVDYPSDEMDLDRFRGVLKTGILPEDDDDEDESD
jgi:hypothetical protein